MYCLLCSTKLTELSSKSHIRYYRCDKCGHRYMCAFVKDTSTPIIFYNSGTPFPEELPVAEKSVPTFDDGLDLDF